MARMLEVLVVIVFLAVSVARAQQKAWLVLEPAVERIFVPDIPPSTPTC